MLFWGATQRPSNISQASGQAAVLPAWAAQVGDGLVATTGGTGESRGGSGAEWDNLAHTQPYHIFHGMFQRRAYGKVW